MRRRKPVGILQVIWPLPSDCSIGDIQSEIESESEDKSECDSEISELHSQRSGEEENGRRGEEEKGRRGKEDESE